MRKLFLCGFVFASLLTWTVAGAYTGTTHDLNNDNPAPSQRIQQDKTVDPAAEMSYSDITYPEKPVPTGPENKPDDNLILQGGDLCASATVIASLPYNNTGTTSGYADNYNEVCPYTPTGSPDVVYKYTPSANLTVTISLCGDGTFYDTKLYVYENTCPDPGNPFACNDDAGCDNPNTPYASELVGLEFVAGNTYYIVVDGYSSVDFGNYQIDVSGTSELSFCPETPNLPIFSQSYLTGINGVTSDVEPAIQVFEDYRTSGTINSVHWWGIKYFFDGSAWQECFEDPQSFQVSFWNDDGTGWPDITAPVYSETFVIGGDDTGDTFGSGGAPIYRYSATLTTPVTLDEGWVSILGNPSGDPDCWFLWHSSTDNNSSAVGRDLDTDVLDHRSYDLSICLNGTYTSLTGSCCDDLTGACNDAVEIVDCPLDNRFTVGVLCANLDPPCGPQAGAGVCCEGSTCTPTEESECDALGGIWFSGQNCGSFTCPTDVVYHKDFDGDTGMGDWVGGWGLTGAHFVTPPNSLTDSPLGNYPDNAVITVTLQEDISLTGFPGFSMEFMTKFKIETGFDSVHCEISSNGGTNWLRFASFNGEAPGYYVWHLFTGDLGGYTGESVRFRFTLVTDGAYTVDGMYIDDFFVYGESSDASPPLIQHTGPTDMTGIPNEHTAVATITDFSGVASASLTYAVDGGAPTEIGPDDVNGDQYTFIIPQQEAGAHVNYFITASDNIGNEGSTGNYHYISGTIVYYDDGNPEFIYQYAAGNKVATRFTPTQPAVLVTGMYRLYTDPNRPLDWIDAEVWSDAGGLPDASLTGQIAIYPESTLENPQAWTHLDLRGMGIDFAANQDFHVGYTYRSTWPVILGDSPMVTGRSSQNIGAGWVASTTDYHIRAVLAYNYGACCDEVNEECVMTYESQCQYTFSLGATCEEVGCGGGGCGPYVVGDYNGSGVFNIADIVNAFSKLKTGSPEPFLLCECPAGSGNFWAVAMDVNASCVFNIADVVTGFSYLKTSLPIPIPCPDCPPGAPRRGGDKPLVIPHLDSKAKINNSSGSE